MPRIVNIPPEEFLINEGATDINDSHLTRFVGHRQLMYASDVVKLAQSLGSDLELDEIMIGDANTLEYDYETQGRHDFDGTYETFQSDNNQESTRQVELTECWVRADRDDDGFAEWRHCFIVGNNLISDEEWFGPTSIRIILLLPYPS